MENHIAEDIRETKDALLFEGWSWRGTHSVAGIAFYCARVAGGTTVIPHLSVLAISPMSRLSDERNDGGKKHRMSYDETGQFDAETRLSFFRKTFEFYKFSFVECVTCLIFDNAQVNKKME